MNSFTNRLAGETSPYLLQHAHNPVDWYPWGDEALERAKKEDKPILISIGYSACHWCHVMEKESFEDKETAMLMNENFINIKIDREERPDLDHIYMDAVQVMTGSGGWPLNVFLTPECKPFYGGTYFPPSPAYNRNSWKEVLIGVSAMFREKRNETNDQAETLTAHLLASNDFGVSQQAATDDGTSLSRDDVDLMYSNLMHEADIENGGFGRAPKFPQSFCIRFLLHHSFYTSDKGALQQALLSLDKMAMGGIYDHLGGGFARYSTDAEWLAPHFEKMLYDNALLIMAYCEAFQLSGKSLYMDVIMDTLGFVMRELMSPEQGFYSALDADSEGVEGKYYVWNKQQIEDLLKEDAPIVMEFFDVTDKGNWEELSILRTKKEARDFAKEKGVNLPDFEAILAKAKLTLFEKRAERVRPHTDDKIILGWNALMNKAFSKAYAVTGKNDFRDIAIANMDFLLTKFTTGAKNEFFHTYKEGRAKFPAFLDDYAFLVEALIGLQEITGDTRYLDKARLIMEEVTEVFSEKESGYFFYTRYGQEDIVIRKKELYDGALPSGNSSMAYNLYYVGTVYDIAGWRERSVRMVTGLSGVIKKYPISFGAWATFLQALTFGIVEVALIGENIEQKHKDIIRMFLPPAIFQSTTQENNDFPLLAGKAFSHEGLIYLCKQYACQKPVNDIDALTRMLLPV